jgi:hypothetical protein
MVSPVHELRARVDRDDHGEWMWCSDYVAHLTRRQGFPVGARVSPRDGERHALTRGVPRGDGSSLIGSHLQREPAGWSRRLRTRTPPHGPCRYPTFLSYMGLRAFLADTLGRRVDLVTPDALKPRMRPTVEREAVDVG